VDNDNNDNGDASGVPYNKNNVVIYCYNDFILVTEYYKECKMSTRIIYGDTILNQNKVYENYIA
jgi:hypothetical protein